jgi:hypothetical protein
VSRENENTSNRSHQSEGAREEEGGARDGERKSGGERMGKEGAMREDRRRNR